MKKTTLFNSLILLAIAFGVFGGSLQVSWIHHISQTIAELFMNLLKLISLPMIFLAIVSTMSQMKNLSEARTLLKKILRYTIGTTLIAATVGLVLFLILRPNALPSASQTIAIDPNNSYLNFLKKLIPSNLVEPFVENNVLAVAFLAAMLSIAILKLPEKTSSVLKDFFSALFQTLLKITSWIILWMPIGIFAFTVQFTENIREQGQDLKPLLLYGLCVVGANLIQGFIILPLMLKWKKLSPAKVARAMMPALVMAFFSKSSNATLPLTLQSATNRAGISEKTAKFSFPLCSIINMNGCAAFILITVFFVCVSHGITFGIGEMILWILLASLAAIGNAGIPMGCFFLTTAFLIGMGIPVKMMGMILPLYSIFDMVETALNVWSDSCVTAALDQEVKTPSYLPGKKLRI